MSFSVYQVSADYFQRRGLPVIAAVETASTNDDAKAEAFSITEPLKIYIADRQSNGRGRGTHSWSNPEPGGALMATFSFFVHGAPQAITSPLVGLAVYTALHDTWPEAAFALKAPNDIYLNGRKVGGLLVEALQMGPQHRLLVGFGLNVFGGPKDVPEAGWLEQHINVTPETWSNCLENLQRQLQWAAQGCTTPHLSDSERQRLLEALNRNDNLPRKYVSVTPFGDLVTPEENISWRSL